jgi:hypothetical protein
MEAKAERVITITEFGRPSKTTRTAKAQFDGMGGEADRALAVGALNAGEAALRSANSPFRGGGLGSSHWRNLDPNRIKGPC